MSKFLEIDIEDYLYRLIIEQNFSTKKIMLDRGVYFRQYKIPGVGIIDLLSVRIERCFYAERKVANVIKVTVFELKRDAITCDNVGQVCRYVDTIRADSHLLLKSLNLPSNYDISVCGVLIGRGVAKDAAHIISLLDPKIDLWTFDFSLENGITFNQCALVDFQGDEYKKGRNSRVYQKPTIAAFKMCKAIESFDYGFEVLPRMYQENGPDWKPF